MDIHVCEKIDLFNDAKGPIDKLKKRTNDDCLNGVSWVYINKGNFMIKVHDYFIKKAVLLNRSNQDGRVQIVFNIYAFGFGYSEDNWLKDDTIRVFEDDKKSSTSYFNKNSRFKSVEIEVTDDYIRRNFGNVKKFHKAVKNRKCYDNFLIKAYMKMIAMNYDKKSCKNYFDDIIYNIIDQIIKIDEYTCDKSKGVYKARRFIDLNYKNKITVERLSKISNLSENKLKKDFKDSTNQSITDYIQIRRVDEIENLLRKTDLTLKEIGREVGYEVSSLNRVFKKYFYESPNNYRKVR